MRGLFVTDLAKNLLGPRGGLHETLEHASSPFSEYVTGMLSPAGHEQRENEQDMAVGGDLPVGARSSQDSDEVVDNGDAMFGTTSPTIDPSRIPSTMGLSFYVSTTQANPRFDVCLTWSKYTQECENRPWVRVPRNAIKRSLDTPCTLKYDQDGRIVIDGGEVELTSKYSEIEKGKWHVSMFMKNILGGKKEDTIFQVQIRVVCCDGTRVIPAEAGLVDKSTAERDMAFMYRNKLSYGKGHMVSVVWREIDPEQIPSDLPPEYSSYADYPPFCWIDGTALQADDEKKFKSPDIRTEFLPILSITSPEFDWNINSQGAPVLKAADLAEMYDPDRLRDALLPIPVEYRRWVEQLDGAKDGANNETVSRIQKDCETVLSRIEAGIQRLLDDDDARMAFCFAHKATDIASKWPLRQGNRAGLTYRPFQLAFVLMSLDSVIDSKSPYRNTCDMLWVPTAAGKTEAYLVLAVLSAAHRRIREIKAGGSGAGVDVLSRYTMRLLTIQQFRRTLKIICAAEMLRVENIHANREQGAHVGWRPPGCNNEMDFLWGSVPFSLGLWVGNTVTPNKLEGKSIVPNALDVLKSGRSSENGDPAQVINCPACKGITAVHEKGLVGYEEHVLSWVVKTDTSIDDLRAVKVEASDVGTDTLMISIAGLPNDDYKILRIRFSQKYDAGGPEVERMWKTIASTFQANGAQLHLECVSATRPGYFARTYIAKKSGQKEYDFDIICPNANCPLSVDWMGGTEWGGVAGTFPSPDMQLWDKCETKWGDGNRPIEALPCFARSVHVSTRVPITAMTVDDQIYRHAPTVVIATVDKFARIPFEPQAGILFGNAEWCHYLHGYYRLVTDHPGPRGTRPDLLYKEVQMRRRLAPPSLIIQDELHLIEGPLGSLVGLYETCIDFLAERKTSRIKYVAATATIKNGDEQVKSLFARSLQIFPPSGTDVSDRFFVRDPAPEHPLLDKRPGRLYMGILAPGKGSLTPLVRIWARLAQTGHRAKRDGLDVDPFWTVTGYFNATRELAGARALYMQDIPDWIRQIDPADPRNIPDTHAEELSGGMRSSRLPSTLELLERKYTVDGLFTTSMFGTGVDIRRIGAMVVVGQPKTTAAYIQSTGRVGRAHGGVVPVFYRASRPRDLSHYEYFGRNHIQMHRTVEPPTVSPFSSGTMDRCLGPVMVGMIRNKRLARGSINWALDQSAADMARSYRDDGIRSIIRYIVDRSQEMPRSSLPSRRDVETRALACLDRWKSVAEDTDGLTYTEYINATHAVVLGDHLHASQGLDVVFHNAPTSLRDVEGEVEFKD